MPCKPGSDRLSRLTFTYRTSGQSRYRAITATADEFLRRFLQHFLPQGWQKVRHYGFVHPRRKNDHERLATLVTVPQTLIYELRLGLTGNDTYSVTKGRKPSGRPTSNGCQSR